MGPIGRFLDNAANAVCNFFKVAGKEESVVLGIFVIFVIFVSVVTGAGLLLAWLFGLPWWSTWAMKFVYYIIAVLKANREINSDRKK
jgi:hypothetical protein